MGALLLLCAALGCWYLGLNVVPAVAAADSWHSVGATGEPAFANGWHNSTAPDRPAQFRKDALGQVVLRGYVTAGTGGTTAFTLPAGYCPTAQVAVASMSNGWVQVSPACNVTASSGTWGAATMDAVRFEPSGYTDPTLGGGGTGSTGATGPTGPAGADGADGADGQPRQLQDEGSDLPVRPKVDIVGDGIEAHDDPVNDRSVIQVDATPAAGGSSGTQTVDSSAIVSAIDRSREWAHADIWWLLGLVCALFFGFLLYRAVTPRA
jgi:hypothetical protein